MCPGDMNPTTTGKMVILEHSSSSSSSSSLSKQLRAEESSADSRIYLWCASWCGPHRDVVVSN